MTSTEALPLVKDWAALNGLPPIEDEKIISAWIFLKTRLVAQGKDDERPTLEATYNEAASR